MVARAVIMNGEPLVMTKGETELELIPFVEGGELMMLWQKHREGLGEAVEITTSEPRPFPCRHICMRSCTVLLNGGSSKVGCQKWSMQSCLGPEELAVFAP